MLNDPTGRPNAISTVAPAKHTALPRSGNPPRPSGADSLPADLRSVFAVGARVG